MVDEPKALPKIPCSLSSRCKMTCSHRIVDRDVGNVTFIEGIYLRASNAQRSLYSQNDTLYLDAEITELFRRVDGKRIVKDLLRCDNCYSEVHELDMLPTGNL